jgi:hypothetical protein
MSLEQVLLAGLSLGGAVLGWLARELWGAVQQLRKDLQSLEVRVSGEYVRYDRLQEAMRPVLAQLERIEAALSHKADKQ